MEKKIITLGAGCFWCVEATYRHIKGVSKAISGYSGGDPNRTTYKEVYTDTTGHAEVVQVEYDPNLISTEKIIQVFFAIHNPTLLNRQNDEDVGTRYRSVIFYHDQEQKELAEKLIEELNNCGAYGDAKIVTQIVPFEKFYQAEDYHQNYLLNNPENSYCQRIAIPKFEKFKKLFKDLLID